jgi:hypothetical protein
VLDTIVISVVFNIKAQIRKSNGFTGEPANALLYRGTPYSQYGNSTNSLANNLDERGELPM